MNSMDLVTLFVIGVTSLVSFKAFNDRYFFDRFKFNIAGIERGEQWRFFTSGVLHADLQHLFFNMFTLFFFADEVVGSFNSVKFLIIYLASMLGGSFLSYIINRNNYAYSAVGASGAVSGIIYSAILLDPTMRIYFGIPGWIFGIGYMIYSIIGMQRKADNIGHDAHIGGAITGYLITLLYDYNIILDRPFVVGAMLLPIIAVIILIKMNKV
ncbi:rhomboid family intramembrane serine protease [Nonlabens sp. SCSIO 43208]